MKKKSILAGALLASTSLTTSAFAAETQLYWGDTHLHTSYSTDAFMAGNRDADPDTAYRLAKGEPVIHPFNRVRVQLDRPLDFLVVSDHAESLGVIGELYRGDPEQPEAWFWERWKTSFMLGQMRDMMADPVEATGRFAARLLPEPAIQSGDTEDPVTAGDAATLGLGSGGVIPAELAAAMSANMWSRSVAMADAHYVPGTFTTIIGWEWTQTNNGVNLHRVVMSDMSGEQAATIDPVGSDEAPYPEQMWAGLEAIEAATGQRMMAIPHNSNLSKGYMFGSFKLNGEPFTPEYARTRMRWEPIVEVTQIKGDSETHPSLSPDDEFADFEQFSFYLQRSPQGIGYQAQVGDFVRSALRRGLEIEGELGVNPYQFGFIGSTDAHTSISSPDEPNFWGKLGTDSIPENKRGEALMSEEYRSGIDVINGFNMSAQGLAAAWATENTREGIFDAFTRKETYATTGPRMTLRVFGGWNYDPGAADAADIADIGYAGGVPMGGDLSNAPAGSAMQLLIRATRDPVDANLDRVQVVKGWLDADGTSHEKVYDVAWAGDRTPGADGRLPAVGNTVNLRTGAVENSIGTPELSTLWTDPDFDASQSAFYYVRVLQIPTMRHTQLDALALGIDGPLHEAPATIQERAYSSPIWYKPTS